MINREESAISFGYEASEEEIQKVILAWLQATEDFHHRFAELDRLISTLQATSRRQPAAHRYRLNRLVELRQHMGDVLMTLLLDMSSGQRVSQSAQLSRPSRLYLHGNLLDELNRQIDVELVDATTIVEIVQGSLDSNISNTSRKRRKSYDDSIIVKFKNYIDSVLKTYELKIVGDSLRTSIATKTPSRTLANSYKVEDVLRLNKSEFLNRVSPKEPLQIPDLGFTEEEQQMMDIVIRQGAAG